MSYFLPSYFQKRLLRYALTRLDFIDSKEFDLDNLGLKWGQRTVLELKNVGIKVQRLVEVLQLPPSFALTHASIKLLRLTLPADLHISGIEVEVEGVEIIVALRPDLGVEGPTNVARGKGGLASDKASSTDIPRPVSSTVHDPGGRSGQRDPQGGHLALSQVLPTSEDLAASFLEAEPANERDELLQAALESQSQSMHESVSSSGGEDLGLAMPGGFSLPSFVANFLKGVADRLSLKVKDVNVVLETDPSLLGGTSAENAKFMLSVGNVVVDAVRPNGIAEASLGPNRAVTVEEVQLFVLSDSETFSEVSGLSSPKLPRSRHRHSRPAARTDNIDLGQSTSTSQHSDRSKLSSPSLSHSGLGLGLEDAMLSDSTIFAHTSQRLDPSNSSHQIDNRSYAEESLQSTPLVRNTAGPSRILDIQSEDLTESRTFTHDEAESMYMSAMSGPLSMPGGFAWSTNDSVPSPQAIAPESEGNPEPPGDFSQASEPHTVDLQAPNSEELRFSEEQDTSGGESVLENSLASFFRARILHVNTIGLMVPPPTHQEDQATSPARTVHESQLRQSHTSREMDITGAFPNGRQIRPSRLSRPTPPDVPQQEKLTVDIGRITVDLDISICRLFVRAGQNISESLPISTKPPKTTSTPPKINVPEIKIGMIDFNFCESVPRRLPDHHAVQTMESAFSVQGSLFKVSLTQIAFKPLSRPEFAHQFSISKLVVTHGSREVLSFVDSINIRDSIATSSMLRPHDIVATITENRYDVQIKPIHVILDLMVIDEVLTKSGGLSSLLDLGNSIISGNTVKESVAAPAPEAGRQRTVRFTDPQTRSRSESDPLSAGAKVNVRVSGAIIDLIGSESSVQIKSSAIKTVYRESGVKLVIDGGALEGPILAGSRSRGEVYAKIRNIELHYSVSPSEDDLDRLLSLITPSGDKYEQEDDIMVDTLLKQRRTGGVLRLSIGDLQAGATGLSWIPHLAKVADEIAKLSSVAKYLPEDDRPGILTFGLIKKLDFHFDVDKQFGPLRLRADLVEGAHINLPSLAAAQIASWTLSRSDGDVLIGDVLAQSKTVMGPPMVMCRFIADEMEPTVRMKLSNTCIEYKVSTILDIISLMGRLKVDKPSTRETPASQPSTPTSFAGGDGSGLARKIRVSVAFRDSAIALNPAKSAAKGLFVLSDAVIRHENRKRGSTDNLDIKKASLLIINDSSTIGSDSSNVDHKLYFEENDQIQQLTMAGFVPVGSMSSASAIVNVVEDPADQVTRLDVEFRNNLLFIETCADSTQTMIQILSGLAPPSAPSTVAKYRTEIIPIQDMLASFTGNAFVTEAGPELGLQASSRTIAADHPTDEADYFGDEDEENEFMPNMYADADDADDEMTASHVESDLGQSTMSESIHIAPVDPPASDAGHMGDSVIMHSLLDFRTDHFTPKTTVGGTAHRWNSTEGTYGLASDATFDRSPLSVRVRDVHVIWNLFDGYDWQATRDTISQAVKELEDKAMSRRPHSGTRHGLDEDEDESVIGDFLFNSIYIGIPANKDPRDLANAINHDIDDMESETGSYATGTTITAATSRRQSGPISRQKKLKLKRSKHHKMSFELEGVSADFLAFPPGSGEVESSIDVRIRKLEVFDQVPTSTWRKFATYNQDAGEREIGTNMVHLEILNVKPVAELSASEIVLKVTVLPLRLHVDQDALDFLSRFFEFRDESEAESSAPSNPPFLQRAEVNAIPLKLDYKPKKVDYAGLRSGRTTEFMNFFVLDRADMVLRRVILYGVSGFDRLGIMLNNIWTPDVKSNQLPGVLAGLAPIRPLVDVASGVRDLIAVPIREYRKDGRVVRSIQKGAFAFAKTTATELVNLGAKMAIGTQQILQNTEGLLVNRQRTGDGEEEEEEEDGKKQISLYADQPVGIKQGLRIAYSSLERDLLIAKDAIVAVPGEVMASSGAKGAAKAILKQSPTIILRPAIGATKAVGQTLMGAGNMLDKHNLRRIDEKYKHR